MKTITPLLKVELLALREVAPRRAARLAFACCLTLMLATACSPKTPKAVAAKTAPAKSDNARIGRAAPTPADVPTNGLPIWNWDAYPAVKKMKLALLPCTLQPRSQIAVNSTIAGSLKLYLDSPQTNLPAGFVFGEFDPSGFLEEESALEEARQKLDERERLLMELELPKQRINLERQLEEMQRQVSMIRLLTTNREFADLTLRAGDNTSLLRPDSLLKAEAELGLLNQSLTYLKETNMTALGIDLPGMRSEWRRRKIEFDRRRAQATLKMPFAGQLTVSLPLAEGVAEYPVNQGQEIAVARDLSTVRLRVPIANSAWNSLPADKLAAVIRLPNGGELEANFAYQKIEKNQNREESAYYFQFLPEHTQLVSRLIGTDVTCELWYKLDLPTRIVPKLALIMYKQSAFQAGNWSAGINSAFPGCRVAVEGQTDIGIVVPRTNTKQASK